LAAQTSSDRIQRRPDFGVSLSFFHLARSSS